MKKILLGSRTGKKVYTLVDDEDFEMLSKKKWSLNNGYAHRGVWNKGGKYIEYLHHYILPKKKGFEVDHINRNRLDNRKSNLRYVLHSINMANRPSGINRNVYASGRKWMVRVMKNSRHIYFGSFETIELARKKATLVRAELFPNVFR